MPLLLWYVSVTWAEPAIGCGFSLFFNCGVLQVRDLGKLGTFLCVMVLISLIGLNFHRIRSYATVYICAVFPAVLLTIKPNTNLTDLHNRELSLIPN